MPLPKELEDLAATVSPVCADCRTPWVLVPESELWYACPRCYPRSAKGEKWLSTESR